MLVVDVDRLSPDAGPASQAVTFQRRFAYTVLSGFAIAFALFAVLFALSGDATSVRARTELRQLPGLVSTDDARVLGAAGTQPAD